VQISAADGTPLSAKAEAWTRRAAFGESVLPVAFWASPSAGKDHICSRRAPTCTVSIAMNFNFALLPLARVVNVSPIAAPPKYE
jgi:hypothetical protein